MCRVTADEGDIGRGHLGRFQDVDTKVPTILTTSQMLTTGVDAGLSDLLILWEVALYPLLFLAAKGRMRQAAPLVRRSSNIEPSDSYAELGIRSFGKGTFHKPALSGFALGSKRIFRIEKGDLLFSNVFAWEGAIAVAKSEDDGRFGSHRFMSCVPKPDIATANFLRFYFLMMASNSFARRHLEAQERNRTLGIEALANIEVPVPSIEKQRWFDALQAEVDELKRVQAETAAELDVLLPAILDRAFNGSL